MSESLNVVALISGGKDSFYSILHCIQNGHKVVALGNVYPQPHRPQQSPDSHTTGEIEQDEEDLNSYMYQTVGHTVIPLYEQATGIPLYRQPILGDATATGATYEKPENGIDETESLVPLLRTIMAAHPEVNAVSTGAILSTYQRTRVESVALRLGLIPLSFLWKYPLLPPEQQISLLKDMASAGLDARMIKVASWGLDESFLWQNVASAHVMQKIERAMMRFGTDEDGAVLGEGGEFETLVLDGPDHLFKGRIVVDEKDRQVIKGSANTAWLRVNRARVEMKTVNEKVRRESPRIPDLLSQDFLSILQTLESVADTEDAHLGEHQLTGKTWQPISTKISLRSIMEGQKWMIVGHMKPDTTVEEEVGQITTQLRSSFEEQGIDIGEVISTLVLLRSMSHFAIFNKIYGNFFTKPNPPARVTIACGDVLPPNYNVVVQLSLSSRRGQRRSTGDLHVQSRSYWAPANIGPYSQARSDILEDETGYVGFVHVAGQIPLVPSTMSLLEVKKETSSGTGTTAVLLGPVIDKNSHRIRAFMKQTVLSLQHLWRVGQAMDVSCWTGAVAYLRRDTNLLIHRKARFAARAWSQANGGDQHGRICDETADSSDEGEPDLWEESFRMSSVPMRTSKAPAKKLPDWSIVTPETVSFDQGNVTSLKRIPPFFAAEVEELPRGSDIEWHALFGITRGPIKVFYDPLYETLLLPLKTDIPFDQQSITTNHEIGSAFKHTIVAKFSQTFVFLNYTQEIQDIEASLDKLLAEIETPEEAAGRRRRTPAGYHHSHAAYLDAGIAGLWEADSYAGVIPCRSLWGDQGQRLAAVLVFQSFL